MNFAKSKVLLKKINAIHDSGESFDGKLSSLEKDLILQYIRQLYECVSEIDKDSNPSENSMAHPSKNTVPLVEKEIPRAIEPQITVHKEKKSITANGHPRAESEKIVAIVEDKIEEQIENVAIDPELDALFNVINIQDLSQRYANAPITDISKAMGINERILTINELFKGDQQAFNDVSNHLNKLSSFEEAKKYLVKGIATTNEWSNNKRLKKAEIFIKLIQRRYL